VENTVKKIFVLSILSLGILTTGCANKVHNYSASTANTIALKSLSSDKVAEIGTFTDSGKNESKVMCRLASPIGTPEGDTFASYIQKALITELVLTDHYDPKAESIITANLNDVYGSTVIGNAYWEFDLTISSTTGVSYNVKSRHDYESSYLATSACSEMQRSFVPAVQQLNTKIISHPSFSELF
jgi:hypothetical protein